MERTDVVQAFVDGRGLRIYLEIGIRSGHTFLRIRAGRKLAVDPSPRLGTFKRIRWWLRNPSNLRSRMFRMTSDEFFSGHAGLFADSGLDIAFIDGLHTYQQSLRDVENCLALLNAGGVILMHDCSPPSEAAAAPAGSPDEAAQSDLPGWEGMWCGDVYKTILHLRSRRRDLRVSVLDCDNGVGVVEPGQPESMLDLSLETIRALGYLDLEANRREWLNLKSPEALPSLVAG
jgi:hypothetical protein